MAKLCQFMSVLLVQVQNFLYFLILDILQRIGIRTLYSVSCGASNIDIEIKYIFVIYINESENISIPDDFCLKIVFHDRLGCHIFFSFYIKLKQFS